MNYKFIKKVIQLPILMLFLATCALLQGCATPTFEASVTTFADWDNQADTPMSYVFLHPVQQEVSLEQKTYEELTRPALEQAGFIPAASQQDAHYLIELKLSSANGQCLESYPIYSNQLVPMYMPGYYWGNNRYRNGFGPAWGYPFDFGPRYMGERVISQNCLQARLALTIRNRKQNNEQGLPRSVYETSAATSSQTLSLLDMVPLLAQAAMSDFPEGNGQERTVTIRLEKSGPEIQSSPRETRGK